MSKEYTEYLRRRRAAKGMAVRAVPITPQQAVQRLLLVAEEYSEILQPIMDVPREALEEIRVELINADSGVCTSMAQTIQVLINQNP